MPFKDPERKREHMRQWRKKSIERGYGKWLYKRRALRYADADYFREALEEITEITDHANAQLIARDALEASTARWEDLGPAPGGGRIADPPKRPDDTLEETLMRIGLE